MPPPLRGAPATSEPAEHFVRARRRQRRARAGRVPPKPAAGLASHRCRAMSASWKNAMHRAVLMASGGDRRDSIRLARRPARPVSTWGTRAPPRAAPVGRLECSRSYVGRRRGHGSNSGLSTPPSNTAWAAAPTPPTSWDLDPHPSQQLKEYTEPGIPVPAPPAGAPARHELPDRPTPRFLPVGPGPPPRATRWAAGRGDMWPAAPGIVGIVCPADHPDPGLLALRCWRSITSACVLLLFNLLLIKKRWSSRLRWCCWSRPLPAGAQLA
jgi:hypothetical protein